MDEFNVKVNKIMTIYENNDVSIEVERHSTYEAKVNVNGENLIWISREQQEEFITELTDVLNKYRI